MTLTFIGDMATASLTDKGTVSNPSRAQMLSRRPNDIPATVIQAQSDVPASTAQYIDRRHNARTIGERS